MRMEEKLFAMAVDFIQRRYPVGWGAAAVMRTSDEDYYISVYPECANEEACLCIETGAICEAHKFQKRITHAVCVVRDDESSPFYVLSPCGICQERLLYWGWDVSVGVSTPDHTLEFRTLRELQPYHWSLACAHRDLERFQEA